MGVVKSSKVNRMRLNLDVVVLVRHVPGCEEEKEDGEKPFIQFPLTKPWPTPEEWEKFGFAVTRNNDNCEVKSHAWIPSWVDSRVFLSKKLNLKLQQSRMMMRNIFLPIQL